MNFFGYGGNQQGSGRGSGSNGSNGQEKSFSQNMNEFFNNVFQDTGFFSFNNPVQNQQQNNQSQQQQRQQQNNYSNSQQPPRQQSSQNNSQQSQQNRSNNRPSYPRFGNQQSQQQSSSQSSQPSSNRSSAQNSNSSSLRNSQVNQNQQNQNRQRNQQQEEPRPTFQNTRSNWKKAEEPKKEKKKEVSKEDTSDYWKQSGNVLFKKGYLEQAIEHYSKAISIDNSQSIYFSNRGRCYKNKGDLKRAFDDAVQAIELDESNLKGQLLCGQVLCEMGKFEDGYQKIENGIKKLTKGLTLCTSQAKEKKKDFEKSISVYIFRAKKLLWYKKYEEQKQKKIRLIENYKCYLEQQKELTDQQRQDQIDDFIFTVGDPYKEDDFTIPDHLCCKITLDLIEDPVTTEAGHTYEKEVIEDHFKKNGYIDPFTRNNVRPNLYPSHAIRQGVEEFLQSNPWAFEYSYGEDYRKIEF